MKRLMLCVLLAAGARPAISAPFNFDWYGRVEVEAAGLQSDDPKKREAAVNTLAQFDVNLT